MEKLTAEQILKRLQEVYETVDNFNDNRVPKSFTYEGKEEVERVWDEWCKNNVRPKNPSGPEWDEWIETRKLFDSYAILLNKFQEHINLGNFYSIDEEGGGEGEGEYYHNVFYFEEHDIYLKVTESYYSHDGTYLCSWAQIKEVTPVERLVKFYE